MQNRLAISGIPASIPGLPNAADSLRDLIEDHGCWVDRFAFLEPSADCDIVVAAAELHIENVRDDAVKSLDELTIVLDESGLLLSSSRGAILQNTPYDCKHILFSIGAAPATALQSKQLILKCPIQYEDDEHMIAMEKQTLIIADIQLTVRCNIRDGGGTGSTPWRGGLLLAHQVYHWFHHRDNLAGVDFDSFFRNKTVLELGAGVSALPSMTLAKIATTLGYDVTMIASDGIDEIVDALRGNIAENDIGDCIDVEHIDWSDYYGDTEEIHATRADTVLFADCIYNEKCAVSLSQAILRLLKPTGSVIGILPDNRVGVDVFEKCMKGNAFSSRVLPIHMALNERSDGFVCTGGGGKKYRMILFRLEHSSSSRSKEISGLEAEEAL